MCLRICKQGNFTLTSVISRSSLKALLWAFLSWSAVITSLIYVGPPSILGWIEIYSEMFCLLTLLSHAGDVC